MKYALVVIALCLCGCTRDIVRTRYSLEWWDQKGNHVIEAMDPSDRYFIIYREDDFADGGNSCTPIFHFPPDMSKLTIPAMPTTEPVEK